MIWIVVLSLIFAIITLVVCKEKEIKLNCEQCKFAEKGVCQRKPVPTVVEGKNCVFFIKRRMK
jgi:hypothetical protein